MSIFDYVKDEKDISLRSLGYFYSREMRIRGQLYNVSFELTPVCNLSCKMCYVRMSPERAKEEGGVLPSSKWIDLAKQVNELGVFYLALTGGECTLHPEFREIYSACYDMGLNVIVMTNASTIDEEMVSFFSERPPALIDLTLYGFSYDTYERVCGNGNAFMRVLHAVDLMQKARLEIQLKTTITKEMVADFPLIARYAKERGIKLRYNSTLKANRECDYETVTLNEVDYDEMLRFQTEASNLTNEEFREANEVVIPENIKIRQKGISCAACNSSCHINWRGEMTPCVTFDPVRFDVKNVPLKDAWERMKEWGKEIPEIIECQTCRYYLRCKHCIALHWGDTGEFGKVSPRLCYKIQHGVE